jgi:drug/metabolite transporter (DMT)-like permease
VDKNGLALVLATAGISGASIFLNKFGVAGINSDLYVLARGILVAASLAAIILLQRNFASIVGLSKRQWASLTAVGLVGGSIPFLLFFRGLQLTTSAESAFIQKTMFVFVAALAVVFLKEKLDKKMLAAAAALLAGNFLFLGGAPAALTAGNLLILAATVLWAVENTFSKHLLAEIQPGALAFGRMFFGAVFVAIYMAATGELSLAAKLSASQLSWIAASAVILLAYNWTWYHGLSRVSATAATCILLLGSPITTALNYAFAGTQVTAGQTIGAILLAAGAVLAIKSVESTAPAASAIRA